MDEGSTEPDVLERGGRPRLLRLPSPGWRPSRGASILAAVTLAIGLGAGYAVGHGQGRGANAVPEKPPSPAGPASGTIVAEAPPASIGFGLALAQETGTCSVQAGRDLELGIPVT